MDILEEISEEAVDWFIGVAFIGVAVAIATITYNTKLHRQLFSIMMIR